MSPSHLVHHPPFKQAPLALPRKEAALSDKVVVITICSVVAVAFAASIAPIVGRVGEVLPHDHKQGNKDGQKKPGQNKPLQRDGQEDNTATGTWVAIIAIGAILLIFVVARLPERLSKIQVSIGKSLGKVVIECKEKRQAERKKKGDSPAKPK
jgi:hypothetical protein